MPNRNNKCRKYERRTTKLNFYLEEGFKIKSRRIQKLISKNVIPDSEICMDIIKKNITNYNFPKEDFNYLLEFANIDKDISLCKKIIKWCLYAENKLSFEMRTKIDEIMNKAIYEGIKLPLKEALELESKLFGECILTSDMKIGLENFKKNGPKVKAEFMHK